MSQGNNKLNEHPRCGCGQCVRGARSKYGQYTHWMINRRIRQKTKIALKRADPEDTPFTIESTPYTD